MSTHSLPFELLSAIMCLTVVVKKFTPGPIRGIIALTHVCGFWRQVALNTPRLWSMHPLPVIKSIPKLSRHGSRGQDMDVRLTNLSLERSAPLPLCIRIDRLEDADFPNVRETLEALAPSSARWGQFKYWMTGRDDLQAIRGLSGAPFDSLECLKLEVRLYDDIICDGPDMDMFLHAPRLRKVHIRSLGCRQRRLHDTSALRVAISLPWGQLTHLLLGVSAHVCLEVLMRCTSLVSARVHTDTVSIAAQSALHLLEPEATLPFLEDFELSIATGESPAEDFRPFFLRLRLPSLKTLILEVTLPDWTDSWKSDYLPSFETFLSHAPNLTHLSSDEFLSCDQLLYLLPQLAGLEKLTLFGLQGHTRLFNALRVSHGAPVPLPNMEELVLRYVKEKLDPAALEEMIWSRGWEECALAGTTPEAYSPLWYVFCGIHKYGAAASAATEELDRQMEELAELGLEWECKVDWRPLAD
ncbi:F-box domain-containing protein [Mycena kentingensis (nom. inval.)]|nr:F-box domain-containing protein [Mycena kentingensis (nom. inval.)]